MNFAAMLAAAFLEVAPLVPPPAFTAHDCDEREPMPERSLAAPQVIFAAMLAAAFLEPAPRVAAFTAGTIAAVALHWREVLNWNLGVQLALYTTAAIFFLRC